MQLYCGFIKRAILSTTAIFIKYLSQNFQIPSLILAFWRDVFVVLFLGPGLYLIRKKLLKIGWKDLIFVNNLGLVLALFNSLWTTSVALNRAAISTILVYCSTCFSVLLGWGVLKERINGGKLLSVAFCLIGCVLVSLSASTVNLLATTEPIFTSVLAFVFLEERLKSLQIWGGICILFGVVLLRISESQQSNETL
ncbi:MAG: DMT family transporter [Candidatus Riflebacteria bacterium]|nr:DMT family transporter [Candidatus Riflebacteria bacterium]